MKDACSEGNSACDARGTPHVFGPVPSRRLGRSLGVDLTPRKVCSFDCIYCQVGRTTRKTTDARAVHGRLRDRRRGPRRN